MTYGEATQWATWDESLVYALGELAKRQGRRWSTRLIGMGWECTKQALARELTLADRDPYEFRLVSFPYLESFGPSMRLD